MRFPTAAEDVLRRWSAGSRSRETAPRRPGDLPQRFLEVLVLWAMAVAQPLFDLVSRNGEFLVAHRLQLPDLVLLVLALAVVAPALVFSLEVLAGLVFRPAAAAAHFLILAVLAAAGVSQLLKRVGPPSWLWIAAASAGGVAVALLSRRWAAARIFWRFLAPVVVVFPLLFLAAPQVRSLLLSSVRERLSPMPVADGPAVSSSTPVVFILFDELPLVSLLDPDQRIDRQRYPAFAALADEGRWYRRATAVIHSTTESVPAILTGLYPVDRRLPILADHPHNLFTWLGASYRVNAFEPTTALCPPGLRSVPAGAEESLGERLGSTFRDLWVVHLHLTLPSRWSDRLPPISATWRDFAAHRARRPAAGRLASDRRYWGDVASTVDQFVARLHPSPRPALHFIHLMLPHLPWKYLPSGKEYGPLNADLFPHGLRSERWTADRWATLQGLQRHLLQLAYTDKVLGTIIDRMRTSGLWEEALVIVTADHGASFWPEGPRRGVTDDTVWEILRVPLLIKFPGEEEGEVVDRSVELVDVLPTIADVLGVGLPWPADGRSLAPRSFPGRETHSVFHMDRAGVARRRQLTFDGAGLGKALARKNRWFGAGGEEGWYRIGPRPELLGRSPAELLATGSTEPSEVWLEDEQSFEAVDLAARYLPARIIGRIRGAGGETPAPELAISVNGRIRATTRTQESTNGTQDAASRFMAMVPETSFQQGFNRVEVFEVVGGAPVGLQPTLRNPATRFRLVAAGDGEVEFLERSDGRRYEVRAGELEGEVVFDSTQFRGWAAKVASGEPGESVVMFHGGEFVTRSPLGLPRERAKNLLRGRTISPPTAFSFVVPYAVIGTPDAEKLSFYAIAGDVAARLPYEERFKR